MSLENCSYVAAIVAAIVAVGGVPLISWQLFIARAQCADAIRTSTSQVLLAADAVLATHADTAAKLRPGGEWTGEASKTHPTNAELPVVEPYLGVFERVFMAYQAGQVDAEMLDELYGYRLANIWANRRLVEVKLQNNSLKRYWKRLIALTYVVEAHRGRRFPLHTDTYFPKELFGRHSAREIARRLS
jgi:hypothetical protein